MADNATKNQANEFLLAEFQALQERAAGLEQAKSSQVNFFLIIVAAFIAGLAGFVDLFSNSAEVWYGAAAGSLILFLLGFATLFNSVDYSISIVSLYRRAGRIRRRFMLLDEEILPFLPFGPVDNQPKIEMSTFYLGYRGGEPVLLIVNALALAGFIISLLFGLVSIPVIWLTFATIFLVVIAWFLQLKFVSRKLRRAEEVYRTSKHIHFPSSILAEKKTRSSRRE